MAIIVANSKSGRFKAVALGIAGGKEPALKHLVRRKADAGHHIGRIEGGLQIGAGSDLPSFAGEGISIYGVFFPGKFVDFQG